MNEILILTALIGIITYSLISLSDLRKKQREEKEERQIPQGEFTVSFKMKNGLVLNLIGLTISNVDFINNALDNTEAVAISVSLIGEFELSNTTFPKKKP